MTPYMSKKGFEDLQRKKEEIIRTMKLRQKQIIDSVKSDNDLRENPEFMSLRYELNYVLPLQLKEVEENIQSCVIIEDTDTFKAAKYDVVSLGSRVTIQYAEGDLENYIILGHGESDIEKNIISNSSPIGQALIGKRVGDSVEIKVPAGIIKVQIKQIDIGIE